RPAGVDDDAGCGCCLPDRFGVCDAESCGAAGADGRHSGFERRRISGYPDPLGGFFDFGEVPHPGGPAPVCGVDGLDFVAVSAHLRLPFSRVCLPHPVWGRRFLWLLSPTVFAVGAVPTGPATNRTPVWGPCGSLRLSGSL